MKITLKNYELFPAIEFLQSMELVANESRPVVKFVKLLKEALSGVQESQMALIEQYGVRDEKNELALTEDKSDYLIVSEKQGDYEKQANALLNEEVVLEGGPFVKVIARLPTVLEKYDVKISGKDALVYDRLLDEFERNEINKANCTD